MTLAVGKAVVASQHYISSLIGLKILEKGGNAFDAALAMSAALSVVLPHTGGLGGDGFLLAYTPNGIVAYNGSGKSPKNFDVEAFLKEKPIRGPLTITIPGLVDLWNWTFQRFCKLSMKEILESSIRIAKEGFHINKELANAIANFNYQDEDWLRIYGNKKLGDVLIQKEQANILEAISRDPNSFYKDLAKELVNGLKRKGVKIEEEDFNEHRGEEIQTISLKFLDYKIHELPPNTQGITTLEILKLYEENGLNKLDFYDEKRIIEHLKIAAIAYKDRDRYIADPKFMDVDPLELLKKPHVLESEKLDIEGDTTFLAAADKEGNMVGIIQSLFHPFGSGVTVNGIVFQNRAIGFSKKKGLPNSPLGGKRPLHTLSIAFAEGDDRKILLGCAGGDLRPQIHSEVLENIICYEMDLANAIDMPRWMLTNWDGEYEFIFEKRLSIKSRKAKALDYFSRSVGICNSIEYSNETYKGYSDLRSEGVSLSIF